MTPHRVRTWVIFALMGFVFGPWASMASAQRVRSPGVLLASTQFTPADEATAFRSILSAAPVPVTFLAGDGGALTTMLEAQERAHHVTISVFAGMHGDFAPFVSKGFLQDLTPLMKSLSNRGFPKSFVKLSRMGSRSKHFYIPWIQATYVLAVNRKALRYLPRDANINALTYDQWIQWGKNLQKATGRRLIGLPAGPTGLLHRFIQGYLYPSYTRSAGVRQFKSPAAEAMWQKFKDLWSVTNPDSTSYNFMQDALLSGSVWIAWDHVARLIGAVTQKPKNFVLVPAPSGPKGLGYLLVIGGLGIPKGAPNMKGGEKLIRFLTGPYAQTALLTNLGFFPVTNARLPSVLPPGIRLEAVAVKHQVQSRRAIPALLPIGLGTQVGAFNKVYLDAFRRIVLNGESIPGVLRDEGMQLQAILNSTGTGCWPPDPPSRGPCRVG